MMSPLSASIRSFGHYIEQPAMIEGAKKTAIALGGTAIAGLTAADVLRAKPEERTKIAIRNGLVLGATALGTVLATRKFMMFPNLLGKGKSFVDGEEFTTILSETKDVLESLKGKYSDELRELIAKPIQLFEKENRYYKRSQKEFKEIMARMAQEVEANPLYAGKSAAEKKQIFLDDLNELMPIELNPGTGNFVKDVLSDVRGMVNFFVVGGASVISGLLGGLAANKVNRVKTTENGENKTVAMIKEGIFQFIANIALCAVGASAGLAVVNLAPVKKALQKSAAGKFLRTGIIGAGLSVGILGGGVAANHIGQRWVTPFFNKLQGKHPQEGNEKRKIEFWDAILHLDDLPTALALAGVAILEPFIPLFFGFSGYRTGIGYRNHHGSGAHHGPEAGPAIQQPAGKGLTSRLADSTSVFNVFHQGRLASAPPEQAANPFATAAQS